MTCDAAEKPGKSQFRYQMAVLFAAQALLGLCFAWSILPETHRAAPPVLLTGSPRGARMLLDSVFLLGLAAGFQLSARFLRGHLMHRQPAVFLLLTLAAAAASGVAGSWTLVAITRALTGIAGALSWAAAERTVRRAVPNRWRWQAMTVVSLGFSCFFLVAAGLLTLTPSPVLTTAILGSSVVLIMNLMFRDVAVPSADAGRADIRMSLNTPPDPVPSGSSCGSSVVNGVPTAGCLTTPGGFESCSAADCCGNTGLTVRRTPMWIGTVLSLAGLLLFFGPLLEVLAAAIRVADTVPGGASGGSLIPVGARLWLFGAAVAAGTGIFRSIVHHMGNTLALPLFLLLSFLTMAGATIEGEPEAARVFMAVAGLLAISGSFHGCLAAVTEYFPESPASRPSAECLTRGCLSASLILAVSALVLVMAGERTATCRIMGVVLTAIGSGAGIFALRKIPAPLLVTRFAERYLRTSGIR